MTIKKWTEVNQRLIGVGAVEWDGDITSGYIPVKVSTRPVMILVQNKPDTALTMTLEHYIRTDDTIASAQIGEGENGVITVSADEPGAWADNVSVAVTLPEDPQGATELDAYWINGVIKVVLAVDELGAPDDTANTAALIATAISEIPGYTAEASGDGSGIFDTEIEAVKLTGGATEIWAEMTAAGGAAVSFTIGAKKTHVFGPVSGFPRWKGGRIKLTAGSAPTEDTVTTVEVVEGG